MYTMFLDWALLGAWDFNSKSLNWTEFRYHSDVLQVTIHTQGRVNNLTLNIYNPSIESWRLSRRIFIPSSDTSDNLPRCSGRPGDILSWFTPQRDLKNREYTSFNLSEEEVKNWSLLLDTWLWRNSDSGAIKEFPLKIILIEGLIKTSFLTPLKR